MPVAFLTGLARDEKFGWLDETMAVGEIEHEEAGVYRIEGYRSRGEGDIEEGGGEGV